MNDHAGVPAEQLAKRAVELADFLETQAYVAECATDGAWITVTLTNTQVREIAKLLRRVC